MAKFEIPKAPATTTKSVRFTFDMIDEVEKAIQGRNCTFSAFVVAAVRMALDDLAEQKNPQ